MKIKRFKTGFTQVPNQILESKHLSFKAKGIYSYMLSKPDDWDFASERMANEATDGSKSIIAGIKELIDYGVLTKKKLKSGRIQYELQAKVVPKTPKGQTAKTGSINNTVDQTTKVIADAIVSDETVDPEKKKLDKQIKGLIYSFSTWNPAANRWYGNKTQRNACELLLKSYDYELLTVMIRVYLPLSNKMEYVKNITTPLQLLDNIATYQGSLEREEFFDKFKKEIAEGVAKINEYNKQ